MDHFANHQTPLPQGGIQQLLGGLHRLGLRDEHIEKDIRIYSADHLPRITSTSASESCHLK
jgi:hypothetical protein